MPLAIARPVSSRDHPVIIDSPDLTVTGAGNIDCRENTVAQHESMLLAASVDVLAISPDDVAVGVDPVGFS